ncbi:MAG TPA: Rid family detoxifying hydrolase [Vicinamibacteria bacterium]|nr:Rid family detoxifying hydrolase [Vicinamibacteria bacterium]
MSNGLVAGGVVLLAGAVFALGFAFGAESAHRRIVAPDAPPRPGAPYSPGVMAGDLLFLSGNIGQNPASGRISGEFATDARQALDNLGKVLRAAGLDWPDVVKVNVYVKDIGRFDEFNKLYTSILPAPLPARTFLQVADLPGGGIVEVEAVAVRRR